MRRKMLMAVISLAGLCLFAPTMTAKADSDINTYSVEGSYLVNIPATVEVDATTNKGTLSISGTLDVCYNLEIGIKSQNNYKLVNHENSARTLSYTISDDKVVFSKEVGSTDTALKAYNVTIRVTDKPVVSGEYTDILTFTMNAKSYAQEATKHKLIFDTNCSGDSSVIISTDEKFVNENETYGVLPTPKRVGYTFSGWYTATESGTKVDETTKMGTTDATVYAHWKANVLTIKYHSGGAQKWQQYQGGKIIDITADDVVVETETVAYDAQYEHAVYGLLDVNRLTKKGYHSGNKWKIGSPDSDNSVVDTNVDDPNNFTGKDVAARIGNGIPDLLAIGDVTVELYPVFVANTYTVQYVANADGDNVSGTTELSTQVYDTAFSLAENGFIREGYTFVCWVKIDTVDGKEEKTTYTEGQVVKNLAETGKVVLYARWKDNSSSEDSAETEEQTQITIDDSSSVKSIESQMRESSVEILSDYRDPDNSDNIEAEESETETAVETEKQESDF